MQCTAMFLEGPGRLRRQVTYCKPPKGKLRSYRRGRVELGGDPSEANTVQDSEGNVAMQVDKEGLLYRFQDSPFTWTLLIG